MRRFNFVDFPCRSIQPKDMFFFQKQTSRNQFFQYMVAAALEGAHTRILLLDNIILILDNWFDHDHQPKYKYDVRFFSYNETSIRMLPLSVCKSKDICHKILFLCQASCREAKEGFDSLNLSIDPEQADAINRILASEGVHHM
jgi:hypothetical protein